MADELTVVSSQVPAKIEELVQFVKIGREKLTAVRAEIRAFEKLGLEDERRKKALEEAQTLSEQLLDAEVSLGEIMATLPEAQGKRTDIETPEDSDVQKSKKEILKEAGFSVKTAQRYEMLAAHPDVVAQMKAEAREKGVVVSRTSVLRAINQSPRYDKDSLVLADSVLKHVSSTLGEYTYIRADEESLNQTWEGNILLFLPRSNNDKYIRHLQKCYDSINEAIIIVPADTSAIWYQRLVCSSNAVVYSRGMEVHGEDDEREITLEDSFALFFIGKSSMNYFFSNFASGSSYGHTLNKIVCSFDRLKK